MQEKLTPEYHKLRKEEGLRGVTAALSAVTSRLGFKYRILYQATDSSRIGVMFARVYDENAVKRMATYSGEPMLALNWGKDDEVMLVESQGCEEGVISIRVEFIVQDPTLDPELVDKLFYEVNFTQEACLTARWTIEYLEKIVDLYIREFARVIEPFGWQIYGGYWLHAEMQQSSDWSTWEVYARAPRDSRLKDICLYIHPFSNLITIQPPHHYEQQDNPTRRRVIDAIIKARVDLKRELEERPFWRRAVSVSEKASFGAAPSSSAQVQSLPTTPKLSGKPTSPPKEPTLTEATDGVEVFRGAWCQFKYDCDRYYGAGKVFTHSQLADKLGMSVQAAKNYYHNVWVPPGKNE